MVSETPQIKIRSGLIVQQKFDDTPPLSIHKFKTIVGSGTGAIIAAGLAIIYLLSNWRRGLRKMDEKDGYEDWKSKAIAEELKKLNLTDGTTSTMRKMDGDRGNTRGSRSSK
jgi:hypothetical protein